MTGVCLVPLLLVLAAAPGGVEAQDGGLDRVAALSEEGRVDEARSALLEWWEGAREGAPERARQRGLWLRGVLTVDPDIARRDFTRLALEHPGGPYSAAALLRLGQAAAVAGRPVDAARHFEQLIREYPDRPERLVARRWLDENREAVARARARATASSESEEGPEPAEAEDATDAPAGPVTVQLGAFSSEERARDLLRRARENGIADVRIARVEESRLIRVRAGRFPTREAASDLRDRVRSRGFDATIVTDADREAPIP